MPGERRGPRGAASLVVAAAILAACGSDTVSPSPTLQGSPAPQIVATPPAFPGSVAATSWQRTSDPPPGMSAADTDHDTASSLLAAFVALLRQGRLPEVVDVRAGFVGQPTRRTAEAYAYVSDADDSVAGEEYRVHMMLQRRGWFVARVEMRTHCRRGIDAVADLCL